MSTKYGMILTDHVLSSHRAHSPVQASTYPRAAGSVSDSRRARTLSVADSRRSCGDRRLPPPPVRALLATENVTSSSVRRHPPSREMAHSVNDKQENTAPAAASVMERLLEEVSFHTSSYEHEAVAIDAAFVDARLAGIAATTSSPATSFDEAPKVRPCFRVSRNSVLSCVRWHVISAKRTKNENEHRFLARCTR